VPCHHHPNVTSLLKKFFLKDPTWGLETFQVVIVQHRRLNMEYNTVHLPSELMVERDTIRTPSLFFKKKSIYLYIPLWLDTKYEVKVQVPLYKTYKKILIIRIDPELTTDVMLVIHV